MKKLFSLSLIFFSFILLSCSSDAGNQTNTGKDNNNTSNTATDNGANGNTDANGNSNSNTATPAPEADSKKKALMKTLVGTHRLVAIEGLTGANTMFDYTQKDGKWTAGGSSNSGGEREAYDIDLDQDALNILNSMEVIVKDDLTVILASEDMDQFSVSYQDKGMAYKAQGEVSGASIPKDLNADTDFFGDAGSLYLYLKAGTEEDVQSINITEAIVNAVALHVDGNTGNFVLTVFDSECCDEANYTFKKN